MRYHIFFLLSRENQSTQKVTWSTRFMFSIVELRNYSQITNNIIEDTK